jgi:PIN domain nuclease of toxin-antitoxin system
MKLLVDSHAVIWAVDDPTKLSSHAAKAIEDPANDLLVSAGTIWEIAIKVGLKKLSLSMPYRQWMNKAIVDLGLILLPVTVEYADAQAGLPRHHGDPFDRLLAAQAQVENISLVSADAVFDQYGLKRVWDAAP